MRRFLMTSLVLLSLSTAASACINDSELPQREREFRSQYMNRAVTQVEPATGIPAYYSTINKVIGMGLVAVAVCAGVMRDAE